MTENTNPDRQADDLGLTSEDWQDLIIAYNYGTIDPEPGTIEAEAFRRLDEHTRRDFDRAAAAEAADEAWRASRRGYAPQAGLEPEAGQ
jgi:hypothetical protein